MDIDIKIDGLDAVIKKMQAGTQAAKKATAFTINQAIIAGKSVAAKEIAKEYNIKPATFKERLKVTIKAGENYLVGVFTAKGRGIPLSVFDVRQEGFKILRAGPKDSKEKYFVRNKKLRGAVSSLVKKGTGRKVEEGKYGNKPFLAINAKGRLVVWERKSKERFPVGEHFGPGLAVLLEKDKIQEKVEKAILDKFQEKFLRNLAFFMGKTGSGSV